MKNLNAVTKTVMVLMLVSLFTDQVYVNSAPNNRVENQQNHADQNAHGTTELNTTERSSLQNPLDALVLSPSRHDHEVQDIQLLDSINSKLAQLNDREAQAMKNIGRMPNSRKDGNPAPTQRVNNLNAEGLNMHIASHGTARNQAIPGRIRKNPQENQNQTPLQTETLKITNPAVKETAQRNELKKKKKYCAPCCGPSPTND